MSNLLQLKLTRAKVIGGFIRSRGTVIEVSEVEARQYLNTGSAELVEGELAGAGPLSSGQIGGESGNTGLLPDGNGIADTHSVDLDKLNLADLQAYAGRVHSEINPNQKKADLLKAIKQAEFKKPLAEQTMNPADKEPVIPTGGDTEVNPDGTPVKKDDQE